MATIEEQLGEIVEALKAQNEWLRDLVERMPSYPAADLRCALCGRPRADVEKLVGSKNGQAVCGDCVTTAVELLGSEAKP